MRAGDAEIEAAARRAGIHQRILEMPRGYDTRIGEGDLSGGEQQRIAIARALVQRPAILVLDEATSGLDPATESAILATLEELRGNTTVLSVTHRLASAADLDRILVLDRGRIAGIGGHHQLLRQGGVYAALWRQQSGPQPAASQPVPLPDGPRPVAALARAS